MKEPFLIAISLFTLLTALGVVVSPNAVYSALSLILTFFGLAALFLVLNATFLAVLQILIYTGAIVVLFVFVVMLLNLEKTKYISKGRILFGGLVFFAVIPFSLMILKTLTPTGEALPAATDVFDIHAFSYALFTTHLWPFEILSFFLLGLIVAVWSLAKPLTEEEEKEESNP